MNRAVIKSIKELIQFNPLHKEELSLFMSRSSLSEPGRLADFAAALTTANGEELQDLLETVSIRTRLRKALVLLKKEIDKLKLIEPASPEFNVSRTYLDWLTILPWGVFTKDNYDIAKARRILDRDHYGLEDVKQRILEFLAVGIMKGNISGSILCFVGPPGVGKTSLGRSIARSIGRNFYRFSLGGIRDEAEIKGHRRTYIGAIPGKFIQSMKVCKSANPVIMLDEVDKIGASYQGDPASALTGSARSRAEQGLPGSLPRRSIRSLQRVLHLHGQPVGHDSPPAAGPDGSHQAGGLYPPGET